MGAALRRVGFKVKSIWTIYRKKAHENTDDPTWIRRCVKEGWIPISGDKKIEDDPVNRNAVIEAKAKVFMLTDSNSHPEEWSSAVVVGADRIRTLFENNQGPFFANVGKQASGHVSRFRVPTADVPKRKHHEQRKENQPETIAVRGSDSGHSEGETAKRREEAQTAVEGEGAAGRATAAESAQASAKDAERPEQGHSSTLEAG